MYSLSFNEEDKNKERRQDDSAYSEENGFSTDPVNDDFEEKETKDDEKPFYSNSGLIGKTTYISSFMDDAGKRPVYPMQWGSAGNVKPAAERTMFPQATKATTEKGVPEYMTGREVLKASYMKDGQWGDMFGYVVPEATPRRGELLYSVSPKAVDDVANDYFKDDLKDVYEKRIDDAKKKANKAYADYGADPFVALRKANDIYDPVKTADEVLKDVDMDKLRQMVEPLARRGGFDVDKYIDDYVKPTLRNNMLDDYIEKDKPKSSGEYMLRRAVDGSLLNKAMNIGLGNKDLSLLNSESLARYDANRLENFVAGVGSLMIDSPVFAGIGSSAAALTGKVTSIAISRLASRIFAYKGLGGMSKEYAAKMAERLITGNLRNRILQSAATNGLTLGTYDLSNSIADDVLYNDGVDGGKAVGSFLKGFATGGAVGAVGTRLKKAMGGLTGGKKMLASTGVLSTESAVFTLSTEIEKLARDIEIEPIDIVYDYAEGMGTLGVMKMTHWQPKGAENKLKADGTLKDELRLSAAEQEELRAADVEPVEFMQRVEAGLRLPSLGIGEVRGGVVDNYMRLMQSGDVSAATKAKLMYIIENRLTSTPPVAFDYSVKRRRDGRWLLTTYDFNGKKVERHLFDSSSDVQGRLFYYKGILRKNRIAAHEHELLQGVDSQNLLRQAGLYAKEKSVSVDDIAQALYKRAQNVPLAGWEELMVRDIVERATYDESGMVQYLSEMRRSIEKKHGLDDGTLLVKVNEAFYKCSDAENRALDEYEAMVREEVDALKRGADKTRAAEFREKGRSSSFRGMTNNEVKAKEIDSYYTAHPNEADAVGSGYDEKPIKIDDSGQTGYVWSYEGVDNTVEDINRMKQMVQDMSRKYNFEVDLISDEREIPYPDEKDKVAVFEYNKKIRSMGWQGENGKVVINLPNIASKEELEKTFVHECVAHAGLAKLFGNHFDLFLEEIYRKASGPVREAIERVKSRYSHADNYTVIEEYLAELTEKVALSTAERSLLTDFKDFVSNSLVRMNIYTGRNRRVTESDLMSLLRQHTKYLKSRTKPSQYRNWVFGLFDAAKQKESTYYDREAYEADMKAKIAANDKFFANTPAPLYTTKILKNYDLLPENQKQEILKRWGATDEEVRAVLPKPKHRAGNGNAAGDGVLGEATLKDVFDDQSFYSRYPELAGLPVEVVDNMEMPVRYDANAKKLVIDKRFLANPDNSAYMPGFLKEVVRDYEGFNKAVSMNLFGIESRLGRKYNEAQKVIRAIRNARLSNPDFDINGDVDKVFEKEYGFTPSEFVKRFPSLDEYTVYRLTGEEVPFSDNDRSPVEVGGKAHSGSVVSDLSDLMKFFNGPLDVVYEKLQHIYSDEPRKAVVEEPADDYGFGEFKKKQDAKRKQLSDAVELRKWRDAFRHLDEEIDELN